MKIGFASDHRGYELKNYLIEELKKRDYNIVDFGTNSKELVDYPDYAFKLGNAVANKEVDFGVAICGSGIGISIACNKVKKVLCAKVDTKEEAKYTRNDNNANIVSFGEKMKKEDALDIVLTFINTPFSNIERYQRRVNKILEYEELK